MFQKSTVINWEDSSLVAGNACGRPFVATRVLWK